MKMNFRIAFLVLLISCTMPNATDAREPRSDEAWPQQSVQNEADLAQALRQALHTLRNGVRLNYEAVCRPGSHNQENVWFPHLVIHHYSTKTGLQAIREMLRANGGLTVKQTSTGVVHISAGTVEGAILKTRLHSITLDQREQYDPSEALGAMSQSQEYQSTIRNFGLFEMPVMATGPVMDPKPNAPHLARAFEGLSVDEFLDRVVRTFGGIISYGECVNPESKTRCFVITYVRP